jgi:(2Fe-2S) ferredoxin
VYLMAHSYFSHHVFFCLNQRETGRACCNPEGKSVALFEYAKQKIAALEKNGPGQVRINKAGCLSRCELGPVIVVYPEAIWYTYVDQEDIDEIINSHLVSGKIVERLRIK